jgi:hypothetical protein
MFQIIRVGDSIKINIFNTLCFIWRIFGVFPLTEIHDDEHHRKRYKLSAASAIIVIIIHVGVLTFCMLKTNLLSPEVSFNTIIVATQNDAPTMAWDTLTTLLFYCQLSVHFIAPLIYSKQYCTFVSKLFLVNKQMASLNFHVTMDRKSVVILSMFVLISVVLIGMIMLAISGLYAVKTGGYPSVATLVVIHAVMCYVVVALLHFLFYAYMVKAAFDTITKVLEQLK